MLSKSENRLTFRRSIELLFGFNYGSYEACKPIRGELIVDGIKRPSEPSLPFV
jgi:hypothetical protein